MEWLRLRNLTSASVHAVCLGVAPTLSIPVIRRTITMFSEVVHIPFIVASLATFSGIIMVTAMFSGMVIAHFVARLVFGVAPTPCMLAFGVAPTPCTHG